MVSLRLFTPLVIGALLLALGIYFFPLGQDVVYCFALDLADGDFWLAWAYLYMVCALLIIAGYVLLKYGWAGLMHPYALAGMALIIVVSFILAGVV